MMSLRKISVLVACCVALAAGFFIHTNSAEAAFGISPPFLNADHLVPGVTYVQTVYLVQDQPDVDLPIKTTLSVPAAIVPWISIDKGFNFIIPAGTRQFPVQITIQVPSDTGLGKYNGNITFTSQPAQSGQVSIALGANVSVNLTVGTGIFEQFSVSQITFPDIEEGWNPEVYVKFENDGNVPEAFDSATFQIYDQFDNVQLAYMQKQDGFPETKAFSTNGYTIEFPTDLHLGIGEYWGNVVFYQNGKVIATQKTIFHVLPPGSIAGVWGRIAHFFSANESIVYLALIVILVGIVVIFFVRRRKK
jgi:hypothetical protein